MNSRLGLGFGAIALVVATTVAATDQNFPMRALHPTPKQYPHEGDLWYDGQYNADSYMNWHAPGNWQSSDKAVEIDISLDETFFDSCTIATDLPINYDDCPTAGWSDPAGKKNFGMGTFDGTQIVAGKWYRGYWYFQGGTAPVTSVNKTWGEVTRQFCTDRYDIWCYGQVDGGSLRTGNWTFGSTALLNYLIEM